MLRMKGGGEEVGWSNSYRWLPLWERLDLDILYQAMQECPWWDNVRTTTGPAGGLRLVIEVGCLPCATVGGALLR